MDNLAQDLERYRKHLLSKSQLHQAELKDEVATLTHRQITLIQLHQAALTQQTKAAVRQYRQKQEALLQEISARLKSIEEALSTSSDT